MRFTDLPHPRVEDIEPCAYITDGQSLFEVILVEDGHAPKVILEDCSTGEEFRPEVWRVKADYRLVRSAPRVPDRLEAA